jgi:hypothetical protein
MAQQTVGYQPGATMQDCQPGEGRQLQHVEALHPDSGQPIWVVVKGVSHIHPHTWSAEGTPRPILPTTYQMLCASEPKGNPGQTL